MPKKTPGLYKRGNTWHINKVYKGRRLHESTSTSDLEEAEAFLAKRLTELRRVINFGETPAITFEQACIRWLAENAHKKSVGTMGRWLATMLEQETESGERLGDLSIEQIHNGSLDYIKQERLAKPLSPSSVNCELKAVSVVLNMCAKLWRHQDGSPWLVSAPRIMLLPTKPRKPYVLTYDEQTKLLAKMPREAANFCLFLVNTGLRYREAAELMWSEMVEGSPAFILAPERHKGGTDNRIVVCNSIAQKVVDDMRGMDSKYVFGTHGTQPFRTEFNHAREDAELDAVTTHNGQPSGVRFHDLKHTFGARLRASGVTLEQRQILLGHTSQHISTYYSQAGLDELLEVVERMAAQRKEPTIRLVSRAKLAQGSRAK